MQTTIRTYAMDAIGNAGIPRSDVGPKVEDVIASMELRERAIADRLVDLGVSLGATPAQVEAALIESGLMAADPEPEPTIASVTTDGGTEMPEWFRPFAQTLTKLAQIAKDRLGVSV